VSKKSSIYIFFAITLVFLFAGKLVLESRGFGRWANEIIIDKVTGRNKIDFTFDSLRFDIINKRIMLLGVKAQKEEISFNGNIGFGVNYDLFFSRKLKLSKIILDNGIAKIRINKTDSSNFKINIFEDLFTIFKKNNLRQIFLKKSKIIFLENDDVRSRFYVENFNVKINNRNTFDFRLKINNLAYRKKSLDTILLNGNLKKKVIEFEDVRIKKGLSSIEGESTVFFKFHSGEYNGNFNYHIFFDDIPDFLSEYNDNLKLVLNASHSKGKLKIRGRGKSIDILGNVNYENNHSRSSVKSASFDISLNDSAIKLENININGSNNGKISSQMVEYDHIKKIIQPGTKIKFNEFEFLVNDKMTKLLSGSNISGKLSGIVSFREIKKVSKVNFNNIQVSNLCIGKKSICFADIEGECELSKMGKKIWGIDFNLTLQGSSLRGNGQFDNGSLSLKSNDIVFKHTMIPDLFGLEMISDGKLNVSYEHNELKRKLDIYGVFKNFSVQGYNLGKAKARFFYDFNEKILGISRVKGSIGDSAYIGFGEFDFSKPSSTTDLNISFKSLNVQNLLMIIPDYLGSSAEIINMFNTFGRGKVKIFGPLNLDELQLFGHINGREVTILQEDFKNYSAVVRLRQKKLEISPFSISKGKSLITGNFSYNFDKSNYNLTIKSSKIKLDDLYYFRRLQLGLKSDLSFKMLQSSDRGLDINARLFNSSVRGDQLGDSSLSFVLNDIERKLKANLFKNTIVVDTGVSLQKKNRPFFLKSKLDINNIEQVFGVLSVENLEGNNIKGAVNLELNSFGFIDQLGETDVSLDLQEFSFRRNDVQLSLSYPYNKIHIVNGIVKEDSILLAGNNQQIKLKSLNKNENIFFNLGYDVPGSIFELFPQFFSSWFGKIAGSAQIKLFDLKSLSFSAKTSDSEVKLANVPLVLQNVNFNIFGDYNFINLENLTARVGGGEIGVDGFLKLKKGYPEISLNYNLSTAQINITDDSYLNVGGFGKIFGKSKPYFFNGSLNILNGEVRDDPKRFFEIKDKFISKKSSKNDFFDFNIKLSTLKNIIIKNSLSDLNVGLNLKYEGLGSENYLGGNVKISDNGSKLYFKGHEFKVTKGNIFFREKQGSIDPYFDIVSDTKINKYNLSMEISGDVKNLNVSFRSDPPLAESDILSLLTLGITLDTTRDLQDSDLESVTSMSLGSLLIDQFGINQGLNESLGIKVSVGPEFSDNNINPIAGKISSNDTARLRSATKIRLSKRISNSIKLNYSSTLGGSLDQSQQMNINFKLNEDVSLQGVYRTQVNEASESIDSTESVGFDFIWKKTFK
jgi:translocation and assembly module TamB